MKRGCIYFQYGFWRNIKKLDIGAFGPNAWDLFCVLRTSKVQAEIPIENFGTDDFLSILWHESGGSCFVEKGQIEAIIEGDNLSIEELSSVFLLDNDENECNKYAQKKGILCLNPEMLYRRKYLVSGKKIPFEFHQKGDYYGLREFFSLPCNSLILIDPHILNDRKYIQHHLKHLLKNVLPHSLAIPFDISVFSGIGNKNLDDEELGRSFFEEILKMLHEIRPRLDFSFSLYQIPAQGEGWHDRFVLTNNLMIEASGGFSVFGPVERDIKAQKDCNFHICQPILDKNGDTEDYYNWIKKTSVESHKESRYQHRRFANTENRYNRLFDLVD